MYINVQFDMEIKLSPKGEELEKRYEDLIESAASREYSAKVVIKATGMSYRQINDWESKGYFAVKRTSNKKWRKFKAKEIFALLIAENLSSLGIQPSQMRWLFEKIQTGDYFNSALFWYGCGKKTYFYSDLKSIIEIETWEEIVDLFRENDSTSVIFPTKALIDKLREATGYVAIPVNPTMDDIALNIAKVNDDENAVLSSIKNPNYKKISITKGDKGLRIRGSTYLNKDIADAIAAQKRLGRSSKITTYIDKNGKITNAEIEDDIG